MAAFGFLLAYFLITIAAPAYLRSGASCRPRHVVMAGCRHPVPAGADQRQLLPGAAVPGEHLPVHLPRLDAVGGAWLFMVSHRQPGILAEIEADLERAPELIEEDVEIPEVAPQPVMA